jgi:hypothetical protein
MANENQQQKNLQETAESLKVAQATQNRLNAEFKESVNLLTKMNNLITDSASKTSSFEKSTINVRKLQTEQERIERRRKNLIDQITQANQTEVQNAKDYIKNIEDRRKKEEEIFKQRSLGNYQQATALNQQLALIQQSIDLQETRLNQEQLSLIAAIQSERALEERLGLLGQEIKSEKDIIVQECKNIIDKINEYIVGLTKSNKTQLNNTLIQKINVDDFIDKNLIKNDPAFQRTRENGSEFGHNAKMGQLMRKSVANLLSLAKDYRVSSRMSKSMSVIKNLDFLNQF